MKLVVDSSQQVSNSALVYRAKEYAFNAEPRPTDADTSLSINDVELMVDGRDKRVVFVTGFCPYQSWRPARLTVPRVRRAALRVEADRELQPGVSTRLNAREDRWPVLVDARTGWVCLEKPGDRVGGELDAVEFAPGCVAVLDGGDLVALWLHPSDLPVEVSDRMPS
jgi:hypothetical protein